MPARRSAASKSPTKAESPSRRKGGTPKKVESSPSPEDEPEAAEEVEQREATPPPRRRGRSKRTTTASKPEDGDEDDAITLTIQDLVELPAEPSPASRKRKAPAKSPASRKVKGEASTSRDLGAGGDGDNMIQCSLCDAKVVQLVRHIRAVHGDDPDYDSKIKEARSLEAKVQSSASPRKGGSNLLDEMTITISKVEKASPAVDRRTHRESSGPLIRPKNTQCPICEKVVRRYDLNKHIRNVHSGEKPNKCPYCDYASPWKGNLNTHIAGVHTKARLHDCIRCGLSFKTRSAMIGHVRKVHDKMYQPKERLFECEECNKKFYKKFHLQRHIRVHTGEKPFTCAFCDKSFASKTNMDSHIQSVHLKIKPFKCGYCEKGFARKKMMLVHIRKYHMNKDENDLSLSLNDVDDITLDDNLDNESEGSVESGEILGVEGEENQDMVLIKMKDDGTGDSENVAKSYMFVPADELPSDMDTTMNTTAAGDQSMDDSELISPVAVRGDSSEKAGGAKETAPDAETAEPAGKAATVTVVSTPPRAPAATQPVVISVPAGQVVQAVHTNEGIVLVTQSATVTEHVPVAPAEQTEKPGELSSDAAVEDTKEEAPVEETAAASEEQPDLVQQALAETMPEVTEANHVTEAGTAEEPTDPAPVSKAIIATSGDLSSGLPANLLASEETEQTDTTNGVPDADFEFLNNIQASNGN